MMFRGVATTLMTTRTLRRSVGLSALLLSLVVLWLIAGTAAACGQVDGITLVPAVLQPACAIYLDAILAATQTFNDISTTAWAQAEALINAILGSFSSQLSSLAARASSINQTYAAQVSGI